MSIEKDLGRIATALERIAAVAEKKPATTEVVSEVAATVAAAVPPAPAVAPIPPPPASTTPPPAPEAAAVPPPPASTTVEPTAEEVNRVLVAEAGRIGDSGAKIFAMLQEKFGTRSVSNIPSSSFNELIAAVKAL